LASGCNLQPNLPCFKMKHLLLIEDDKWLAEAMSAAFNPKDYQLHVVHGAHAALPLLDSHQMDAVILDIFLPRANGLQLLQEFKSHQDTQNIAVVVVSASTQQFSLKDLNHLGVSAVIDKAELTPDFLRNTVEKALAQ
jgi:CheY-like chemotaxis protein